MRPSLDALACFITAARTLNFRAASKAQGLTPAALGKRIAQLEADLGVKLFHRTTRRVELTDSGRSLLPHAQRLLERAEQCVHIARGSRGHAPLELTLGTRHELGMSWILPVREGLSTIIPHLTIHLYFGSAPDLERRLHSLELDLAVTSHRSATHRIEALALHREDYVLVGAPERIAEQPLNHPDDARHHTLLDAHDGLPLFGYLRPEQDLRFDRVVTVGTIEAIRALVRAGEGVAVLPLYFVRGDLEAGTLVKLLPDVAVEHDFFRLLFRSDDARRELFEQIAEHMRAEPLR